MEGKTLALLITRALQILCAAVVLGLSASLSPFLSNWQSGCDSLTKNKYCNLHGLIHSVEFCAFVGALGLIDAFVGIASAFVSSVPYIVTLGLDGVAAICYLAGGVVVAVWLGKYPCGSGQRCSQIEADSAFEFLGLIVTLVLVGLGFIWQRSGKTQTSAYGV